MKIHPFSDVHSNKIGNNTSIWQYTIVLEGAKIGDNCNICSHCFIENDVVIGNQVTIKNGVQIWDGTVLEDNVFIGPNVTFTNDKYPKSKNPKRDFPKTLIKFGASIGGGCTILPGITIGENALIGAGTVITQNIPSRAVVVGNPLRILRYLKQ